MDLICIDRTDPKLFSVLSMSDLKVKRQVNVFVNVTETSSCKSDPKFAHKYSKNGGNLG